MSRLYDKYNQENYFTFDAVTGIYDYMSSPIVDMIQALKWESTVASNTKELDELALLYFNNEQLWWVLAIYNKVIDPTDYESENPTLFIPNRLDVEMLLSDYIMNKGK